MTNTLRPAVGGTAVGAGNKILFTDAPSDDTYYYAITSREHSGLESDELSEVIEVTVTSGDVSASQIAEVQGQQSFWTTAPTVPSGLNVVQEAEAGHYTLDWTEPVDAKVRFYHIYYSTAGQPAAGQQRRIASLPVGIDTYLDWLADTGATGIYGISSVDWYGNESAVVY